MEKTELIKGILERQQKVNDVLTRYIPNSWMDLHLTVAQLKSLFFITNEGTTSCRKLAAALGVTPQNVTGIVDRLVERGLVSRQGNPEDRRMHSLRATEKGEALVADLRERRVNRLSEILTLMSQEELVVLARAMEPLVEAAGARREEIQAQRERERELKKSDLPVSLQPGR